jgi:hypothetical protein
LKPLLIRKAADNKVLLLLAVLCFDLTFVLISNFVFQFNFCGLSANRQQYLIR